MSEQEKGLLRPQAPKDPAAERPKVYLMLDSLVEARPAGGGFQDVYYLSGRVAAKLKSVLPELDPGLAEVLQTAAGFREYVQEVGVSAVASDPERKDRKMHFVLSIGDGAASASLAAEVPLNGEEVRISTLSSDWYSRVSGETQLSSVVMSFPEYMTAKASILLYLKDGVEVPKPKEEHPVDFRSPAYRTILEKSLLNLGNTLRLKRAAEKAKAGEDVTVAFIGGSITQGAAAKPIGTQSYAYLAFRAFQERFAPETPEKIHFVKAGVGGTSSEFGVVRYERDLLRKGVVTPDIVVIEFAVNDLGDDTEGVSYESLALKAMKGPGGPAVVLLFSVFIDDWNLQDRLSPVGFHYDLPMVSIKDAVVGQFYEPEDTQVISKRQFFYDLYHPTNEGHRLMADCLDYLFARAEESALPAEDVLLGREPVIGNWLQDVRTVTRETVGDCPAILELDEGDFTAADTELQCVEPDDSPAAVPEFSDNWMFDGGEGKPFAVTVRCRDLMIIFKDSGDASAFGAAVVTVDGGPGRRLDPLEVGWTHCTSTVIVHDTVVRERRMVVTPPKDRKFTILGLAFTGA